MNDKVNHPSHYTDGQFEVIELTEMYSFVLGNAIKYICRAGKKEGSPESEDLAKAQWYLRRACNDDGCICCCNKGSKTFAQAHRLVEYFAESYPLLRTLFGEPHVDKYNDYYGDVSNAHLRQTDEAITKRLKELGK